MLDFLKRGMKSSPRVVALDAAGDRTKKLNRRARKRNGSWAAMIDSADRLVFTWSVRRKLYKHLAGQVGNGIPVEIALDKHASQLARKKKTSSSRIVKDAGRLMRDGDSLAESLAKWIPAD